MLDLITGEQRLKFLLKFYFVFLLFYRYIASCSDDCSTVVTKISNDQSNLLKM